MYVSYNDARSYAQWAGVDLPNEAEWLYACRAGTTTKFYWGDTVDDRYLWHRCNTDGTGTARSLASCRMPSGPAYDIVGNAWEYCETLSTVTRVPSCGAAGRRRSRSTAPVGNHDGRLLEEAVAPRLQEVRTPILYSSYPWDDDRGFPVHSMRESTAEVTA